MEFCLLFLASPLSEYFPGYLKVLCVSSLVSLEIQDMYFVFISFRILMWYLCLLCQCKSFSQCDFFFFSKFVAWYFKQSLSNEILKGWHVRADLYTEWIQLDISHALRWAFSMIASFPRSPCLNYSQISYTKTLLKCTPLYLPVASQKSRSKAITITKWLAFTYKNQDLWEEYTFIIFLWLNQSLKGSPAELSASLHTKQAL